MKTIGAILAGGRSRRFGSDKAVAICRGRELIECVLEALRPHVADVVICGREWPGEVSIADRPSPDLGPLGGLNAALAHGFEMGFARVLSVPCDVPTITSDLLQRLAAREGPVVVAELPVIGMWPTDLGPRLDRHLAADGSRSVMGWACDVRAERLIIAAANLPPNINRIEDLNGLDG